MISVPKQFSPILAVDDDQGLLLSVKASLLSAGMPEPAIASDSRLVMDLIRKNSFQLVLLDLVMPHLDGIALLEKIKKEFPDKIFRFRLFVSSNFMRYGRTPSAPIGDC